MIGPLKAAGVVAASGAILSVGADVAEAHPPDSTLMMYSLAVAVIGLATLAIKNRRSINERPIEKISNAELMRKLEGFSAWPSAISNRLDKLSDKVDALISEIGLFREMTVRSIADHGARIAGIEARLEERRRLPREG